MRRKGRAKPGFTLVEVIVVIVMMSILAAAGLVGFGAMVSHFNEQQCIASRREAAQAFVSEWLEGDIKDPGSIDFDLWMKGYLAENETKDGQKWGCKVIQTNGGKGAGVCIWCTRHRNFEETHIEDGYAFFGGDVWMEIRIPELVK